MYSIYILQGFPLLYVNLEQPSRPSSGRNNAKHPPLPANTAFGPNSVVTFLGKTRPNMLWTRRVARSPRLRSSSCHCFPRKLLFTPHPSAGARRLQDLYKNVAHFRPKTTRLYLPPHSHRSPAEFAGDFFPSCLLDLFSERLARQAR